MMRKFDSDNSEKSVGIRVVRLLAAASAAAFIFFAAPVTAKAQETVPAEVQTAAETGNAAALAATQTLSADIGLFAYIPIAEGQTQNINTVSVGGKEYLFLPSNVSEKSVVFHYNTENRTVTMNGSASSAVLPSDQMVDITNYLSADTGDGSRILNVIVTGADGSSRSYNLYVCASSGIASVFISSSDPAKGREYVDASKSNKAEGSMVMFTSGGQLVYSGGLSQIKARGNSTFNASKKPYQIKLAGECNLVQTGSNSSKTWILLANAYDPTLLHNTVAYRMASSLGINAPDCRPVDLYYDGNYRGNYLLCEKVEIGSGRVEITDLSKQNEAANEGRDLDAVTPERGTNKYGDTIQYIPGMNNPADISGGYLLEQDDAYYQSERSYFITSTGTPFVVKSPENCSREEMEYISCYVEEMIKAASSEGGVCAETGKNVWDYIDRDSLVRYFTLEEMTKNADAFSSSTYLYLGNGSRLMAGPVWDFDDSYGIRADKASVDAFTSGGGWIGLFMNNAEFKQSVRAFYNSYGYSRALNAGIDSAASEIAASQKMNRILWNGSGQMYQKLESYEADIAYFKNFASGRAGWLKGVWAGW